MRGRGRIVVAILAAVSMLAFGAHWVLWWYFGLTSPTAPDPHAGHAVPLHYHDQVVYLTSREENLFSALLAGSIVGFLSAFGVEALTRRKEPTR
jgi:hypothetical protein